MKRIAVVGSGNKGFDTAVIILPADVYEDYGRISPPDPGGYSVNPERP
jgi:hypothetical protein